MTRTRPPTVASFLAAGDWRPIPNCPGRYLFNGVGNPTLADLIGPHADVGIFHTSRAADPVHVVVLPGGGLISYAKPGGRFVHTLNTAEGFARKLEQLGIPL